MTDADQICRDEHPHHSVTCAEAEAKADDHPHEYEVSPEDLAKAVVAQGDVLEEVATLARKAKLSGNPGVSTAGAEILVVVERVL